MSAGNHSRSHMGNPKYLLAREYCALERVHHVVGRCVAGCPCGDLGGMTKPHEPFIDGEFRHYCHGSLADRVAILGLSDPAVRPVFLVCRRNNSTMRPQFAPFLQQVAAPVGGFDFVLDRVRQCLLNHEVRKRGFFRSPVAE